ncbi:unnamed protein product, partial [Polarella glacialis]
PPQQCLRKWFGALQASKQASDLEVLAPAPAESPPRVVVVEEPERQQCSAGKSTSSTAAIRLVPDDSVGKGQRLRSTPAPEAPEPENDTVICTNGQSAPAPVVICNDEAVMCITSNATECRQGTEQAGSVAAQ